LELKRLQRKRVERRAGAGRESRLEHPSREPQRLSPSEGGERTPVSSEVPSEVQAARQPPADASDEVSEATPPVGLEAKPLDAGVSRPESGFGVRPPRLEFKLVGRELDKSVALQAAPKSSSKSPSLFLNSSRRSSPSVWTLLCPTFESRRRRTPPSILYSCRG